MLLIFLAGSVASFLFIIFGHYLTKIIIKLPTNNKITGALREKLVSSDLAWERIRKDRSAVMGVALGSVLLMLSLMLIYWGSTGSLGIRTVPGAYMIFTSLASISLLFNFTPGSIGVRELLYTSAYSLTAISAKQVVAFSLVDRVAQLMVIGAAWSLFGRTIVRAIKTKP